MALVVVLSVMNGFRADLMSKILGVNSHLLVMSIGGPFAGYREAEKKIDKVERSRCIDPFHLYPGHAQ